MFLLPTKQIDKQEYSLHSIGLPVNKLTVNHQFLPEALFSIRYFSFCYYYSTISHSLIIFFQFLVHVLVLLFRYLKMRLCNGFKFKILMLALETFWSSEKHISKPVYVSDCPCKGTRNKTTYIIYVSARTISIIKFIKNAL